jgi:hypothetical protein
MRNCDEFSQRPTWRLACAFSLLALLLELNLKGPLWAVSGPGGVIVDFVLRSVAWLYVFGLCGLSVWLAIRAMRVSRDEGDRVGARWSVVALAIAAVTIALAWHAYRVS